MNFKTANFDVTSMYPNMFPPDFEQLMKKKILLEKLEILSPTKEKPMKKKLLNTKENNVPDWAIVISVFFMVTFHNFKTKILNIFKKKN